MMHPLISVIVPVYNVEKYIKKCLNSILAQTIIDILEIIVVNDGSTDKSGMICDTYGRNNSRIHVFHKENGGLSSARNYGIERAKGKYIGFVDSDDYIKSDMYEVLYRDITEYQADLAMCGLYDVFDGKPRKIVNNPKTMKVNRSEAIKIVMEADITSVTAVNKLYKRELFDEIRYPEGRIAEDAFVIINLLDKCKAIVINTVQEYYYIHRSDSITTKPFHERTLDVIEAYKNNKAIIERDYPELIDVAKMRLCWAHFYVLDRLIFDETGTYSLIEEDIIRFLRGNCGFIIKDKRFRPGRKLSEIMLCISKDLYKFCVMLQNQKYKASSV